MPVILEFLVLAFLGGLILNLMPCVLPILSLKIMSVMQHAHGNARQIRREAIFYTIGILTSFTLLGTLIIVIQSTGRLVSWGFQMQSPVFVALMTYLMFLIGLSFSGVIYFPSLMGSREIQKGKYSSFWVGVIAVLVGAPCTAPFMGLAVGYALTASPLVVLAIFATLGIGFALPTLILSFFPPLLRRLPKPGPWMDKLRHSLAFLMYATTVWFLTILNKQVGMYALTDVGIGLVLLCLSIWVWKKLQLEKRATKLFLFFLFGFISLSPIYFMVSKQEVPAADYSTLFVEESYSYAKLKELRDHHQPVFVEVTASWCAPCRMNQSTLKSQATKELMVNKGITFLKADMTNSNYAAEVYMRSLEVSGIPTYVYYPSQGSPRIMTGRILTDAILREFLKD